MQQQQQHLKGVYLYISSFCKAPNHFHQCIYGLKDYLPVAIKIVFNNESAFTVMFSQLSYDPCT